MKFKQKSQQTPAKNPLTAHSVDSLFESMEFEELFERKE